MKKNCIFCRISEGKIPSKKIYENCNFFSVPDANPVTNGHSLVISKEHFKTYLDIPIGLGQELVDCIKNTAIKLILIFSVIGIFLVFLTKNYLWILFKNERLPLLISILIFAVPFDAIKSIYANTIKGLGQVKYLVYSENIGENIIKILGTIILLYFGLGRIGASVAYVLSMIFSFIVLLYFTNKLV